MRKWVCTQCGRIYYGWSRFNICYRCGYEGEPDNGEKEDFQIIKENHQGQKRKLTSAYKNR